VRILGLWRLCAGQGFAVVPCVGLGGNGSPRMIAFQARIELYSQAAPRTILGSQKAPAGSGDPGSPGNSLLP
jgi:hypothetical protein